MYIVTLYLIFCLVYEIIKLYYTIYIELQCVIIKCYRKIQES